MKYLKFTHVDAITGISVASEPARNGPSHPAVVGLQFVWARESKYPTNTPELFGTCPDSSATQIDGVLGLFVQADFESMQADEMNARAAKVASGKHITNLAFRNRFTPTEKVDLEIASLDDPTATMAARKQAAGLRVALKDQESAIYIDLDRDDTRAGVEMLEAAGLIAAGRAAIVLDAQVTEVERFRG